MARCVRWPFRRVVNEPTLIKDSVADEAACERVYLFINNYESDNTKTGEVSFFRRPRLGLLRLAGPVKAEESGVGLQECQVLFGAQEAR